MLTIRLRIASSLMIACAAIVGCKKPADADAQQQMPPPEVGVVTLKAETVTLSRELPGRAVASLVAEVRPQVSGIVKQRLFTEGGLVRAGQPLYQLDDATYRADSASAQAALNRAQAALTTTRLQAERSAQLATTNMISKQDNDNAQAMYRQAQADVKAAQAVVAGSGVQLGYARITAPIGGQIGKSSVTQGALVTAAQTTPLATIQQLDPMFVDLTQSSTELLQLRRDIADGELQRTDGVPVTLLMEDGSKFAQEGRLSFSEATVDPTTGSVSLRVVVKNPNHVLLPGMYVRAMVANGERKNAILAPQQGITRDAKGNATAMVVGNNGKAVQREVVVSRTVGDKWLVESGLAAGDRLIVEGLQKVRPDTPVKAAEAGSASAQGASPPNSQPSAAAKQ